jgi:hypothetical protein
MEKKKRKKNDSKNWQKGRLRQGDRKVSGRKQSRKSCLKQNGERCSEGMAEIKFKNAGHIISVCTFVPTQVLGYSGDVIC